MASDFQFEWRGREIAKEVGDRAVAITLRIADQIATQLRLKIDTPAPPHSQPGEYPHRVTGALQQSARAEQSGSLDVQIVADASHAIHVEKIRPFLSRFMRENQRIVTRAVNAAGMVVERYDVP